VHLIVAVPLPRVLPPEKLSGRRQIDAANRETKPEFSPGLLKLEVQMKFHLSRAVVAIGLGASLWFASVSSLAAPQQTKDQGQTQTKDQTSQQTPSTSSSTDKSRLNPPWQRRVVRWRLMTTPR